MANSVVRLNIDSHEFDANIKRAGEALNKFFDQAKKGDRTFEVLDDDAMEVVKTFGKMETSSKSARGQLSELTKGFTDLSLIYKRLTDEEKASPVGKEMARSLGQLKTRIQDTKKDLASINQELSGSKFGQFGGIIDGIGRKMGVNANLTELLTSKTALMTAGIGASVAAIYKGTEAWAKYNAELSRQDQQTQVVTGLKGTEADHMTDVMRAISDTYKVDFRQAIEAANTLMSQFGVSGSEAIQLIKDGMQGMIQGDGPKLLSMIQQYAPAFRDAGVSASQLVAVIHNSEGGIFTDQNMSAIVMGMKNIRLMTKQTSEALAKLGIDGNQMSQDLNNGTLTVFDALKQVASKLKEVDSNSKTAGEVMQTVFGRQGAMAGTNLAKAIETLNTNLEQTKKQTGDVGDAFADLQTANEKLNTAIRDCFEYDGWEQMATGIKTKLVTALADVLEKLADIKGYLMGFDANQILKNVYGDGVVPEKIQKDLAALKNAPKEKREELYKQQLAGYERRFQAAAASPELQKAEYLYHADDNGNLLQKYNPLALIGKYYTSTQVNTERAKIEAEKLALEAYKKAAQQIMSPEPEKPDPDPNKPDSTVTTARELNPMQQAQKEISALTEEALTADEGRLEVIKKEIAALQEQVRVYQSIQDYALGKEPNWNIQVGDRKAFEAEQKQIFEKNGGTASRLQSMQYSVMQEIKADDIKVDTETLHTLLKDALQNSIDTTSLNLTPIAEQIGEGINVPDETWQGIIDQYNELREQIGLDPIQVNLETGKNEVAKQMKSDWKDAAGAVQSLGSALQSIEDPAAKVMGIIAQAIATVALTFSKSLAGTVTPWEWIAAAAAGTATMISTITAIKSATAGNYAEGGIVPGNSFSGDNLTANVNSGELILSMAQQDNLTSLMMQGSEGGQVAPSLPFVTADKIVLGINNWARSNGYGHLIFSQRQ